MVTTRQRRGVKRSDSSPQPTLAMDSAVPRLNTPAATPPLSPTSSTRYGTRLNPTLLEASVPRLPVTVIIQKVGVRMASRTVQLLSGAAADAARPPEVEAAAPSGCSPKSSGWRRMNSATGTISASVITPI